MLRQVIEARLARLGAEAQRLLAIAAMIGQEVPLVLWQQVSGADEATLLDLVERVVAARVIAELSDGSGVTFSHALIREALSEGIPASRRRGWHRAIADAIIATRKPDPDIVAYHLGAAGDARTVEWLVRAGERADAADAHRTADARFTEALALLNESDDLILRCELLLRLGRLRRQRDTAQSVRFFEEALRLALEAGDAALIGVARFRIGTFRAYGGERRRGIAQMEEALASLDALPADATAARLASIDRASASANWRHHSFALRLVEVGRFAEAVHHVNWASSTGSRQETANRGEALAVVARMMGKPMEARQHAAAEWTLHRSQGEYDSSRWNIGDELFWSALAFWTDDHRYLQQLQAELDARTPEPGEIFAELPRQTMHLPLFFLAGEWTAASAIAEQVRRTRFVAHPFTKGVPLVLSRILVARGDAEAAWSLVREALPDGAATEPGDNRFPTSVALQRIAAELAIDAGDLPEARSWLEAHDRWLAWSGAVLGQAEGLLLWARFHRAAGDDVAAHERASAASIAATAPRLPLVLIAAHRLLGELTTIAGRFDDADHHLDEATALAKACAAPYERALTLLARAELRAATGDTAAAIALREEAQSICASLGARPALLRADALTARLASRPQELGASLPDGLTERETNVLWRLALGSSNREIGEALKITTRTAERHISNIYAKIGVYSRAEAATYAIRRGLL